ncbi:ImmA/IrrE family metallo-endopeptidase [Halopseudomonas salina]|uniref:ImmA/IrrE family metallo-endopeptidase n=1 Tax=Halopseudomonas salina TaxID=1323744 RepID=A0ABQ1PBC5_9GAMM|nr:ImmA/IrrE family metallo-endopeptidase [Halopseudomonas salina]GGC91818.1 ImmA/IrrE family metallo-endopeptidase [Halopseudomonas salina]
MKYHSANDVLKAHWDGKLPVNPAAIARDMGITVKAQQDLGYCGLYRFNDGAPEIIYSPEAYVPRLRFTVAHELGHHVNGDLHAPRDDSSTFSSAASSPIEVAANQFAAALLMPADVVRYLVRDKGMRDLGGLADKFGVSPAAMRFRLKNLGLI